MKKKDERLYWVLAGVFAGVLLAGAAGFLGAEKACPDRVCLGGAEVVPVSDRGYFDVLHRELSEAKSSIHIAAFEMKYYPSYGNNSKQNVLVEDLVAAKNRGVDVKVVIDEFGGDYGYKYLKENGVDVRFDLNSTTTHSKLVIIDGRIVVLGSTNFSYYALERNNEVNVLIISEKIASYFEDYFRRVWDGVQ